MRYTLISTVVETASHQPTNCSQMKKKILHVMCMLGSVDYTVLGEKINQINKTSCFGVKHTFFFLLLCIYVLMDVLLVSY